MRLILLIVGVFASIVHSFAATNSAETGRVTLTPEEREWIARHPVMRVGVLTNWAPFSYIGPNGQLSGIDVELLSLISQRTGLKFELVPHESWEAIVTNLDHLDMVSSVENTPLREQVAEFTKEYSASPLVIVEREGEVTFGNASVVRHRKLALPRRYIVTQLMTNRLPSVPVVMADTQEQCFELVARKKADATIANLFVASQYLNTHPERRLAMSGVIVKPQFPLRMAVHRDPNHSLVVGILNKGLASISQQEFDDIFATHLLFGLEARRRVNLVEKRAAQALIVAAIAAFLLLSWNFFMRKEILARRNVEAKLREANESMKIFSHSISHDLRAPLRGMSGFAQALREDYHDKLDADGREYLDRIISSGAHMDKMITDVLAYSRATRSEWPLDTVELDPLVHQLINELPPEQRQYFEIDSKLPAVRGHSTLLAQCFGNFFSNAVQYVPKGQTPHVVIRATHEHSNVTVFVEDNGIGIDPKDQKRIFQMFQRAAPAEYKGTGIGLAVAAKAVERMGGSVGVESEVGKGSRFWIRLHADGTRKPAREARQSQPFWRRFVLLRGN